MKKLLSILGTIGLTTICTTSLISCKNLNNNKNESGNKSNPKTEKPQEPPKNSKWSNIPRMKAPNKEFLTANNKWYFYINKYKNNYLITKFYFDNDFIKNKNTLWQHLKNDSDLIWNYNLVYRWGGNGEPNIIEIDKNTGKIKDWKE